MNLRVSYSVKANENFLSTHSILINHHFLICYFFFYYYFLAVIEVLWHAQARNDNDDEISNDSLQSSSSSSGKRGCCKVGRSHFLLVLWLSYRRRGYLCCQNEWVSEWVSQWVMVTIEFPADLDPVFARCSLYYSFFVLEYYRRRETSHNNFTMARKKTQSFSYIS